MQLSQQQTFNEALVKLAVLLYQVDRKVTLTEQDYLDNLIENIPWESPISVEAFVNNAIFETRKALDVGEGITYLRELKPHLVFDADKTLEVAMAITGADGERSEEETEFLSLLTHKLLAKALVYGESFNQHSELVAH